MRLLWLEQRTDNGVKPREALGFIQGMTGSHWKVLPPGLQYKDVIWQRELTAGQGSLIIQFTHALLRRLEMRNCTGRSKTGMGEKPKLDLTVQGLEVLVESWGGGRELEQTSREDWGGDTEVGGSYVILQMVIIVPLLLSLYLFYLGRFLGRYLIFFLRLHMKLNYERGKDRRKKDDADFV